MRTSIRIFIFALAAIMLMGVGVVKARNPQSPTDDLISGAQLYDRWYAVLGVNAPAGDMPIWERQTNNTRSGPDTWRCSECHGWDYKGSEGAYASGSHATGFPNVMKLAADMAEEEILGHLKGSKDPSHDFSKVIDDANLEKLVMFLKEGLQDDSAFVDGITLKAKSGNSEYGKKLFDGTCAACHGFDGKRIVFRSEGLNEYLGSIANRDPYRFLHRTRFGVAGTEMPAGRQLGWKDADSLDVLTYVQSLPAGTETESLSNAGAESETSPKMGGPQGGVAGGMLAGLMAVFGMVGFSVFFLLGLVILGALIVWALRKRS